MVDDDPASDCCETDEGKNFAPDVKECHGDSLVVGGEFHNLFKMGNAISQ